MAQFSVLGQFVDDNEEDQLLLDEVKQEIEQHLDELVYNWDRCFPER